jgi:hypothetical protein
MYNNFTSYIQEYQWTDSKHANDQITQTWVCHVQKKKEEKIPVNLYREKHNEGYPCENKGDKSICVCCSFVL